MCFFRCLNTSSSIPAWYAEKTIAQLCANWKVESKQKCYQNSAHLILASNSGSCNVMSLGWGYFVCLTNGRCMQGLFGEAILQN